LVIPTGAGHKPNIPDGTDEEEIEPYATVHISRIFGLNAENNDSSNNDIPLETLQLRAPQEERRSGRAELQNSAYENTDHLGRPSVTPVEYLFYQPRYENETVDTATSKVVIRPGYDKLTPAKREKRPGEYDLLIRDTVSKVVTGPGYDKLTPAKRIKRPGEYDSLIRDTDPRCKSRREISPTARVKTT